MKRVVSYTFKVWFTGLFLSPLIAFLLSYHYYDNGIWMAILFMYPRVLLGGFLYYLPLGLLLPFIIKYLKTKCKKDEDVKIWLTTIVAILIVSSYLLIDIVLNGFIGHYALLFACTYSAITIGCVWLFKIEPTRFTF